MLLASVGIGAAARALRAPDSLARLLQLLPGVAAVWWKWEQWPELITETAGYVATAYAPMPPRGLPGADRRGALAALPGGEAVARGLDRPGWTFPVLVLPYLVPALVLSEETSPVYLALSCAGATCWRVATAVYGRSARTDRGHRRDSLAISASPVSSSRRPGPSADWRPR
ncbi:MAG: hypothetical protein KIT69_00900 [Propionibacteriaceae bacterium]|nr:hypothetical protein [Propionibacteriaceae bacterium]